MPPAMTIRMYGAQVVETVATLGWFVFLVVHFPISTRPENLHRLSANSAPSFRPMCYSLPLANDIVSLQEQMSFRAKADKRALVEQQSVRAENLRRRHVLFESARHLLIPRNLERKLNRAPKHKGKHAG